jgi:hypothetical protein
MKHNYPDANAIEEIPIKLHQKIFKELNICEALVDILYYSEKFFDKFETNLVQIIYRVCNKI